MAELSSVSLTAAIYNIHTVSEPTEKLIRQGLQMCLQQIDADIIALEKVVSFKGYRE